jgi:putative acetyltransferase
VVARPGRIRGVIVRRERPSDVSASRAVQAAAFAGPDGAEPAEARLLDELRSCEGWIDRFSWVAEVDGVVVGHCVCTRAHVGDVPVLGLGPIGVRPDVQHAGVGRALVHATIGAADACGEPLIGLLGSPTYYGRFGFRPSTDVGVEPPQPWGEHFQVRTLTAWPPAVAGVFRYSPPFDAVS